MPLGSASSLSFIQFHFTMYLLRFVKIVTHSEFFASFNRKRLIPNRVIISKTWQRHVAHRVSCLVSKTGSLRLTILRIQHLCLSSWKLHGQSCTDTLLCAKSVSSVEEVPLLFRWSPHIDLCRKVRTQFLRLVFDYFIIAWTLLRWIKKRWRFIPGIKRLRSMFDLINSTQ